MAFELSEYLLYAGVLFAAFVIVSEVMVLVLAAVLLSTAMYSLIVRVTTDHERARVYRIISAALLIAIGSLVSGPAALGLAIWGLGTLLVASREHVSHRGYIPVHRS